MEFFDQRLFRGTFTRGIVGGRVNTTRFTVIFLTSSGRQAIFLNVGAATFLTTQHGHAPYLTHRTTTARIIPLPPVICPHDKMPASVGDLLIADRREASGIPPDLKLGLFSSIEGKYPLV